MPEHNQNRNLPPTMYALGIVAYTLMILSYLTKQTDSTRLATFAVVGSLLILLLRGPSSAVERLSQSIWNRIKSMLEHWIPQTSAISHSRLAAAQSYNLVHERLPIVLGGITLNAIGMALASTFSTIMYLDMVGTAVAAFLLGPWYGAIVACISSGVFNSVLFPQDTLSWMIVNIMGGMYWGTLAAMPWFRLLGDHNGPKTNAKVIMRCGVGSAFFLAFFGTITQFGLSSGMSTSFGIDSHISVAVFRLVESASVAVDRAAPMINEEIGIPPFLAALTLANFVRYVPDKVLTVMLALLFIRTVFPLHWKLLVVRNRSYRAQRFLLPRQPFAFFALLLLVTIGHHLFSLRDPNHKHTAAYSIVYLSLLAIPLICGIAGRIRSAVSPEEILAEDQRARIYQEIQKQTYRVSNRFDKRGVVAVMLLVIVLTLPIHGLVFLGDFPSAADAIGPAVKGTMALVLLILMVLQLAEVAGQQQAVFDALSDAGRFQRSDGEPSSTHDTAADDTRLAALDVPSSDSAAVGSGSVASPNVERESRREAKRRRRRRK